MIIRVVILMFCSSNTTSEMKGVQLLAHSPPMVLHRNKCAGITE